jgi:hypothetical protein
MDIISFFGLEPKSKLIDRASIAPRPLQLLPEVAKNSDKICDRLQPYLSRLGYNS